MAMSLAFHIVFAAIGIGLPLLMVIAEALWLRTRQDVYLTLAKRWANGAAILFAVGAVSGTVLSFELGLLWPGFMKYAGAIIGMPFSLEGFAFFAEAIFLGIYLYGWQRVPPAAHLGAGIVVAVSGAVSGLFVVAANAWMNTPTGFTLENGVPVNIDPIAAMLNPSWFAEALHMTIAAYLATAAVAAGIHAWALRRDRGSQFHRKALGISLAVLLPAALVQPISGDVSARLVARTQPAKLAAMEGQFATQRGAPLRIGGLPDPNAGVTRYALEIPYGLSLLATHDPNAEIKGLLDFPRDEWPPVQVVHPAFQIMVGCGLALMGLGAVGGLPGLAPQARARPRADPAGAGPGLAAGLPGHRGRLGGHRGRPPALGGLRFPAHRRRRQPGAGLGGSLRHLHPALHLPGRGRGGAAAAAGAAG
jgi:cytochrome d ubiquinol oxidase subunit I